MNRTDSKAFRPCRICGRRPYVTVYGKSAVAVCDGAVYRPHKKLVAVVCYKPNGELLDRLADGWNYLMKEEGEE